MRARPWSRPTPRLPSIAIIISSSSFERVIRDAQRPGSDPAGGLQERLRGGRRRDGADPDAHGALADRARRHGLLDGFVRPDRANAGAGPDDADASRQLLRRDAPPDHAI